MHLVAYAYYLSKYVELLDTVILALKGKPLSFLHVFHHASMPIMCWLWIVDRQSMQEIALLTNTLIHVIMYYYYYRCAVGKPPRSVRSTPPPPPTPPIPPTPPTM